MRVNYFKSRMVEGKGFGASTIEFPENFMV